MKITISKNVGIETNSCKLTRGKSLDKPNRKTKQRIKIAPNMFFLDLHEFSVDTNIQAIVPRNKETDGTQKSKYRIGETGWK